MTTEKAIINHLQSSIRYEQQEVVRYSSEVTDCVGSNFSQNLNHFTTQLTIHKARLKVFEELLTELPTIHEPVTNCPICVETHKKLKESLKEPITKIVQKILEKAYWASEKSYYPDTEEYTKHMEEHKKNHEL
jgi:hypothetical protein